MTKAWNYIVFNDERLDKMMSESLAIYDQALYHLRQAFFDCRDRKVDIETPNYNQLWNIVKNEEKIKQSNLDYNAKQYTVHQTINVWSAYIKARIAYKENPKKFTGEPQLPNYLYKKKSFNLVQIDKTRFCKKNEEENSFVLPKCKYA